MSQPAIHNSAEAAAQSALDNMYQCIHERKNFRLEAGAGAGKTYSLVKALQLIIDEEGAQLVQRHQKVACITYTNVATDEVARRTDGHPAVQASTIHSFCWELCKNFQGILRLKVLDINPLKEKIDEVGGIGAHRVGYDLGHRHVTDTEILLHHDDVLKMMVAMLEYTKFRRILTTRFPVLLIDEYQDTDKAFAESVIRNFVATGKGPLVGLFGDIWQRIYGTGVGLIEHDNLELIGKKANFRSAPEVVKILNQIRPELPQEVSNPAATGSAQVYHTNNFTGQRRTGSHWSGDLPPDDAHKYLTALRDELTTSGWDFSPLKTKILMLTHSVLASEQCYSQILKVFRYNESLLKKEDPHIAFLADIVEPACISFIVKKFGEMFSVIGRRTGNLSNIQEKRSWARDMQRLVDCRSSGTIGNVVDLLKETRRPRLPDAVLDTENRLADATQEEIDDSLTLQQIKKLRQIPYSELISVTKFINDHTPFSTKHGVKGAEFENVLVVLGRGWNQYNWNQFLEWFPDQYPRGKEDSYIRNRNLFYVVCSRPKRNLALLFIQELTADAFRTLEEWFGVENISPFDPD